MNPQRIPSQALKFSIDPPPCLIGGARAFPSGNFPHESFAVFIPVPLYPQISQITPIPKVEKERSRG
jgi:hypothetical protein